MSATTTSSLTALARDRVPPYGRTALLGRLLGPVRRLGPLGWILPLVVTLLAGVLRFWNLDHPHAFTFDETYYVKDAYALLQSGYERQWDEDANEAYLAGNPAPLASAAYVVHPPLGKWLIAVGMLLFGPEHGFGWRFSSAVAGTLSVLLVALIAQRLFSSAPLGGVAGLLTAVEGHHLVMSRTALLDIFQMFFVLAAFYALLLDREHGRRKLSSRLSADVLRPDPGARTDALLYGPWLAFRPWRGAAGLMLGGAVGVKWSALAFVAVFGLMTVLWDVQARRVAGIRRWLVAGLFRDGIPAFVAIVPTAALAYVATWAGWLTTNGGYDRQWAAEHPESAWPGVPAALRSLTEYHRSAYEFHQGLNSDHSWESGPWTWLAAGRPVLFYYVGSERGEGSCVSANCAAVVTDLPNPFIWWAAALSLAVVLLFWAGGRDWRAGAVLSGVLAGFGPWFGYPDRTMFFFYTIVFQPFMVLSLTYVLALVAGRPGSPPDRRRAGFVAVAAFLVLVILVSAFFWPVWTGETIPLEQWTLRRWMPSWG